MLGKRRQPQILGGGKCRKLNGPPVQTNAMMQLNELRPGTKFRFISQRGPVHAPTFTMSVEVNGNIFEGSGSTKKLAKLHAAEKALKSFVQFLNAAEAHKGNGSACMQPIPNEIAGTVPQGLADLVSKLVLEKFSELTNGFTTPQSRRKVLAGVVMMTGDNPTNAKVIAVTTGTKCIHGKYMSDRGLSVNDCHAEILSRRSLLHFMYTELSKHLPNVKDKVRRSSIFIPQSGGGYKLRDNIHFHLYISTAPCGDSRIFSSHESAPELGDARDNHPNHRARGQLRTKIESGKGTITVKSSRGIQTWDGILEGDRLLTMSCSDKIARWNILGVQGALLSLFIEPIYFESVILGSLYHGDHLMRALCSRIASAENITDPFKINQPYMSGISNPESRQPGKAPKFAINWCYSDPSIEVINAMTGKREDGQKSRLCKQSLFQMFNQINNEVSPIIRQEISTNLLSYSKVKALAIDYQLAKQKLFYAFQKAGLGSWVKKPFEQDMFMLSKAK